MNFLTDVLKGMQHPFQNRVGASSCSCIPVAAAAAVPRKCSCFELQLQLLRPFSTPAWNCRSNCSQLFPGCSCSCSPPSSEVHRKLQLQLSQRTAASCYKLQLQLSQRTAAATNCSCRKVAASPAFPPPGLKVHQKQPLVLRTMACNCSSIDRLI